MFAKIEHWLSFGGQYTAAALVYFGITLLLVGSTFLDPMPALAQTNSCWHYVFTGEMPVQVPGCPAGQQCCMYSCVPNDHICCEDGTSGLPPCECCDGCGFNGWTTIKCD